MLLQKCLHKKPTVTEIHWHLEESQKESKFVFFNPPVFDGQILLLFYWMSQATHTFRSADKKRHLSHLLCWLFIAHVFR